jgi:S-adenosylmethionine:tRNA ribosyltransferase-isomerase
MRRPDFHYELPSELIAQQPARARSASRLLCLPPEGAPQDRHMTDFPDLLEPGDLLVFNDTRVIPARLYGHKDSGGKVEILVERLIAPDEAVVQLRASKTPRAGTQIFAGEPPASLRVLGREDDFFRLRLEGGERFAPLLERAGHMPLPPYIQRADAPADRERYQTVFAREPGAVAAPTAGLHFDEALLARIRERGVRSGFVTLHVGAGTFQPVRSDDLSQHRMHAEHYHIGADLVQAIAETRAAGGRIVAVGTTVVRALESSATDGHVRAGAGETRLFITPGFRFRVVDALLTNFHLPESTLLMLVCAFAGHGRVMAAYRHAVEQRYRFFSYGDAMWMPTRIPSPLAGED